MTDLKEKFNESVNKVNKLEQKPSNEILLKLYGLYKQVTVGNINTAQPSGFF